eukprot:1156289-Pelagomonas_calceolata.AAC.4
MPPPPPLPSQVDVDPDIQAPELLQDLFAKGATLLLEALPRVLEGQGPQLSSPQDEQQATHAAKELHKSMTPLAKEV